MTIRDIAELSFQRFRNRSMRFFLTVFGVGIGIGVVFFLVSLGFGLQEVVIGRIANSESLLALDVIPSEGADKILPINNQALKDFRQIEDVEDVSPLLSVPTEISQGQLKAQTLGQAVNPSYFRYAGIVAKTGKLFGDQDANGVVVSASVLRLFELSEQDSLGKEVQLTFFFPKENQNMIENTGKEVAPSPSASTTSSDDVSSVNIVKIPTPFKIIGIVEGDSNAIYLPLNSLSTVENVTYAQAKVRVKSQISIDAVRATLMQKGFSTRALTDTLTQLNQIFNVTQISLAALGIVALFIASVGMFNTLTISLLERTREVGILKTIGASAKDIWMIFLFEAVLIGVFGGFAGVAGGYLFSRVINFGINILANRFGGKPVELFAAPLWFVITIFSVAVVVGFLTGLYPARRAATINPLKALKHE